jgi:hypothetical protein
MRQRLPGAAAAEEPSSIGVRVNRGDRNWMEVEP